MPFLNKSIYHEIKYPDGRPVAVLASFKGCGDLIPQYVCYEDDNCELHKVKIDAIRSINDKHGVKSFCCLIVHHGMLCEVLLDFHIAVHYWIMI